MGWRGLLVGLLVSSLSSCLKPDTSEEPVFQDLGGFNVFFSQLSLPRGCFYVLATLPIPRSALAAYPGLNSRGT